MARGNADVVDESVDTPTTGEVDTPAAEGTTTSAPKSSRPKLEDGLVSPIEFRNTLAKPTDEGGRGVDIRPQIVYSYIRNQSKNDPFPVVMSNGRPGVKLEDALAWWDRKEQRKTEREANKAAKEAAAAAKAAEAPAEAEGAVATEAE
jgi:hypothetical protein